MKEMLRELINKVYNSTKIDNALLDEIEVDLVKIAKVVRETQFSRELATFIASARAQKSQVAKNNFKFLILSNLEKRYRRLCDLETSKVK